MLCNPKIIVEKRKLARHLEKIEMTAFQEIDLAEF